MQKVYVVTLNWNGAEDTCRCVESLLALNYEDFEIVICDNASAPDSIKEIRDWAAGKGSADFMRELSVQDIGSAAASKSSGVTLIHTGANLGFAGGMNVGIRYAMARGDMDFIWLINNDTVVNQSALKELVTRITTDSKIGICGSTLIEFHNHGRVEAFGGAIYESWRGRSYAMGAFSDIAAVPTEPSGVESRMSYVIGASMLVTRRMIEVVGLMDESYFLYSEEHDWAFRAQGKGFRLGYAPASLVFHKHGGTIGTATDGGSPLSLFYLYRAKMLFSMKHQASFAPIVALSLILDAAKFVFKGKPSKGFSALRGLIAAPFKWTY